MKLHQAQSNGAVRSVTMVPGTKELKIIATLKRKIYLLEHKP
jgi:hypothetical protein